MTQPLPVPRSQRGASSETRRRAEHPRLPHREQDRARGPLLVAELVRDRPQLVGRRGRRAASRADLHDRARARRRRSGPSNASAASLERDRGSSVGHDVREHQPSHAGLGRVLRRLPRADRWNGRGVRRPGTWPRTGTGRRRAPARRASSARPGVARVGEDGAAGLDPVPSACTPMWAISNGGIRNGPTSNSSPSVSAVNAKASRHHVHAVLGDEQRRLVGEPLGREERQARFAEPSVLARVEARDRRREMVRVPVA